MDAFIRNRMLLGDTVQSQIENLHVAVFGIGGVGGYAVEALARCGVGKLTLFDGDCVSASNINRQIIANTKTVGEKKVCIMKKRILEINPNAQVFTVDKFLTDSDVNNLDLSSYDYVIDAIDTVKTKIALITKCYENSLPIISCMGTGGKIDPSKITVCDVYQTEYCPLARAVRSSLKKAGVKRLKVVYSPEKSKGETTTEQTKADGEKAPPSMIFVPAVAGLTLANQVILDVKEGKI